MCALRYDAVIVGGGAAGLTAALRLKQLQKDARIAVLEKGARPGAHTISGCVMDTAPLTQLLPDWQKDSAAFPRTQVKKTQFRLRTGLRAVPRVWLPSPPPLTDGMRDGRLFVVSMGDVCAYLAAKAEQCGVDVLCGFGADSVLYADGKDEIVGVRTKDLGVDKHGRRTAKFEPGVCVTAPVTIFAEGSRGHLTGEVVKKFGLMDKALPLKVKQRDLDGPLKRRKAAPQAYALGLKEVWRVDPNKHKRGLVRHSIGAPLDMRTYGGSFEYHAHDNLVYVGHAVGLDYADPRVDPYHEFQLLKEDSHIRELLKGGECVGYGARVMAEGGIASVPGLATPGALICGEAGGFMNSLRLKGVHLAMQTAMLAAEAAIPIMKGQRKRDPEQYEKSIVASSAWKEMYKVRNVHASFDKLGGLVPFMGFSAVDSYVTRGHLPFTWTASKSDRQHTKPAHLFSSKRKYPETTKRTNREQSLQYSGVSQPEDQPSHLVLKNPSAAVGINYNKYGGLEQRYCPAGVYEYVRDKDGSVKHVVHPSNCLHCKTCDIKDPTHNIRWTLPQGPSGPNYQGM